MNLGVKMNSKLTEKQSEMRHGTEKAQNADLLLFTMKNKVCSGSGCLKLMKKRLTNVEKYETGISIQFSSILGRFCMDF